MHIYNLVNIFSFILLIGCFTSESMVIVHSIVIAVVKISWADILGFQSHSLGSHWSWINFSTSPVWFTQNDTW